MGKSGLPNIKITKYVLPYFFRIFFKKCSVSWVVLKLIVYLSIKMSSRVFGKGGLKRRRGKKGLF